MISRRSVALGVCGAILAIPPGGRAQQAAKIPIVGVLLPNLLDRAFPAFLEKFRELGYEDGRNVRLVIRSADAKLERLPGLAAELVAMKADVIVSSGTPATRRDQCDQGDPDRDVCGGSDRHRLRQQPRPSGRECYGGLQCHD